MYRFVLFSLGLVALIGCDSKKSPSSVVTGTVTYKGQPVNGATLLLYPANGNGKAESASIPVTQEGTYRVSDLPEGEYKVVISPSKGFEPHIPKGIDPAKMAEAKAKSETLKSPPTIPIPEKYKQQKTSDLSLTVTKGEQKKDFELKD